MKKEYWDGALGVYRFYQLPVLIIFFLQVDEVVSTKFSSLAACYHAIPVITDPNPLHPSGKINYSVSFLFAMVFYYGNRKITLRLS